MGDHRGTRSWLFLLPAWRWRHHDDEGAALVPKEEDEVKDTAVELGRHHDETTTTTEAAAASSSSSRAARWWRLPATRGVGLVIGGLVVLAVLLATTTTWWPHLDYSSSSFLLGNTNGVKVRSREGRRRPHHAASSKQLVAIPFSCGGGNGNSSSASSSICRRRPLITVTGASPAPSPSSSQKSSSEVVCPDYFRYIHSDLDPWRERGGITREAVESARHRAAFRLVVVDGRAYVETYHRVFQTRDSFTQWGIAQLLARYPGRVPDLDLMFNCEDMPEVYYTSPKDKAPPPPPLFRYCKDDASLDIVFPDWSFWGWPEVNIRPWAPLLEEMEAQTRSLPWPDREPYAFWKGNPGVSPLRGQLLRCNASKARVFRQDWGAAIRAGFRDSNLARQCRYRYKIFVQGRSWSVSQKYILACDSPVLLVRTPYKDFFSRGLLAGKHYWPIDPNPKMMCPAIDFAVDWGNAHPDAAQRMAQQGSAFAREDLSMDYVYDYMLHLLTQYAKLLRYKPTVPENAVELCPETLACPAQQKEFSFMMESRERYVADYEPCTLPPPFTADDLIKMAQNDKRVRDKVHTMMMTTAAQNKHR